MGSDITSPHYAMFDVLHEKWASIAYSAHGPGGPGVAAAIKAARARQVCELQDTWESNRLVASLLGVSEATVRNWGVLQCADQAPAALAHAGPQQSCRPQTGP